MTTKLIQVHEPTL